jgi:hypothetical protein
LAVLGREADWLAHATQGDGGPLGHLVIVLIWDDTLVSGCAVLLGGRGGVVHRGHREMAAGVGSYAHGLRIRLESSMLKSMGLILLLALAPLAHRYAKLRVLGESLAIQLGQMVHLAHLHVLVVVVLLIAFDLIGPLMLSILIFVLFRLVEVLQNG